MKLFSQWHYILQLSQLKEKKMTIQFHGSFVAICNTCTNQNKEPNHGILLYVDPLSLCRVCPSHDPWWPNREGNSDPQCLTLEWQGEA